MAALATFFVPPERGSRVPPGHPVHTSTRLAHAFASILRSVICPVSRLVSGARFSCFSHLAFCLDG